jgi:WD repeat-containing protein 35
MISRYAECAATADDDETWIRKNSLLVLMYEGIVEGVFDYDYAPMSLLVGRKRLWLNITQEGKDDIDDLRQGGLLNGLKLSSEDLQPVTAYQVSAKGKELASLIPREFRTEVDNLIFHDNEVLEVDFDMREGEKDDEGEDCEPCFWLKSSMSSLPSCVIFSQSRLRPTRSDIGA